MLVSLRSVRHEIEGTVCHDGIAQARGIYDDPGRDDEVNRLGKLLNFAVDRICNPGRKVNDPLQKSSVGVL
jgi:hypothetical protein